MKGVQMKKTTFLLIVVVALLLATPAFAREHEPTGDQIVIRCDDPDAQYCWDTGNYPADTAFYISHGWIDLSPSYVPGQIRFELEVDGVNVPPTYVEFTRNHDPDDPGWFLNKIYFFNFPEGMTGTHTFEGHWITPCVFVDPECKPPMADFDWTHSEYVITFY